MWKKYMAEIILIIGVAITSWSIFNFSYFRGDLLPPKSDVVGYFYDDTTKFLITIGFSLITTGVLMIKNKK